MPLTLSDRFETLMSYCRTHPDKVALVLNHVPLTWAGFGDRVQAFYDALAEYPAGPVLISGHKELDIIPAMVAATFANRGFVFAEFAYPASRVEQIINTCSIAVMIRTNPKAAEVNLPVIDAPNLPSAPLRDLALDVADEENLFYITFTSGSTGVPKGIPTTRSSFASLQGWFEPLNTGSKGGAGAHVNHASMAFDMSMSDIWTALFAGRTLYLIDHADTLKPRSTLAKITSVPSAPVGTLTATPAFFSLMLGDPKFNDTTLPALKSFWIGGETVQQAILMDLKKRFPDCEIHCAYGPSEAACVTHSNLLTDADINSTCALDLGAPQLGCDAMVATENGFERTGKGEIILLGDQVAHNYLPLEHPNNEKFGVIDGQRFFYTGDLGEIDAQGRLKIFGRSDSQVKINGHRVELGEIERQAMKMDGVKMAVALCPASDRPGKDLVLVVTPDAADGICKDGVRQYLKDALPAFMVPAQVVIETSMPLSVAGKIDRKVMNARLGFN